MTTTTVLPFVLLRFDSVSVYEWRERKPYCGQRLSRRPSNLPLELTSCLGILVDDKFPRTPMDDRLVLTSVSRKT